MQQSEQSRAGGCGRRKPASSRALFTTVSAGPEAMKATSPRLALRTAPTPPPAAGICTPTPPPHYRARRTRRADRAAPHRTASHCLRGIDLISREVVTSLSTRIPQIGRHPGCVDPTRSTDALCVVPQA